MAKRTSRVAWALVLALAIVVLGGIWQLCASHVVLLPRQEWGFGREIVIIKGITRDFQPEVVRDDHFKFGPVAVRW
jgi:hypothetical protein